MLDNLKKEVLEANLLLPEYGLVVFTWGNVSLIDETRKYVVIKPSGVDYKKMTVEDMVVVDMDGNVVEGKLQPSSDLATHLELYKNFKNINAIVHDHSNCAVAFAQAGKDITALGTTHADYFYGSIPCTRKMTNNEIENDYELNTGKVIVEEIKRRKINPEEMPAVLVHSHGPFIWGKDAKNAVFNAKVLEEVADMAIKTLSIDNSIVSMQKELLDKHFLRKHGVNAYYGQK